MLIAMDEVETAMRNRRHLHPREEDNFDLQNAAGALEGWKSFSKILITALPLLVGISLVVRCTLIMNILLMAVPDRTRSLTGVAR